MKKFLIALLAALLVVGMFSVVAMAEQGDQFPDGPVSADKDPGNPTLDPLPSAPEGTVTDPDASVPYTSTNCQHYAADGSIIATNTHTEVVFNGNNICTAERALVTFCDDCGQPIATEKLLPLGHDVDDSDAKIITPATCVTSGTMEVWCKRCNQYVVVLNKTMAPGHRFDKGTEVRKATCVDHGVIKYVCLDCGEIVEEETAMVNHTFDFKKNTTRVRTRANCEEVGGYEAICLTCGGKFCWGEGHVDAPTYLGGAKNAAGVDVIPAVSAGSPRGTRVLRIAPRGHDYRDGVVLVQVTCQTDGTVRYNCKNTDQTMEYEACDSVHIVTLLASTMENNALTHELTNKYHVLKEVIEKQPTATEPGIHYYYCTVPGCTYASKEMAYYANAVVPPTKASTNPTTAPTTAPKPNTTPNKKGVSIPKTNDTTSNLPYVLIAVAFVGLVALVASKRKVNG